MNSLREAIAAKLEKLRFYNYMNYERPDGDLVITNFYTLAKHCFVSFPIPDTHFNYVNSHLGVNFTCTIESKSFFALKSETITRLVPKDEMLYQLDELEENTEFMFTLELQLRAIEVIFSFGKFEINQKQFIYLENLINRLDNSLTKKIKVGLPL